MNAEAIHCPVREHARIRPDAPALVAPDGTLSWAELDGRVGGMAAYLDKSHPPGSRVAVRMEASVEYLVLILAALRTGHTLGLISTRLPLRTAEAAQRHIDAAAFASPRARLPMPAQPYG